MLVDSLAASSGYGLFVEMVADLRDLGAPIEDAYDWAMENRLNIHHWFFSTDLTFYIKGGRVSKLSGWFGTALKICPLLNMNHEGKLIPREKIRTKQRVIKAIVEKMAACAKGGENYSGRCYISNSACIEDAEAVKALVEERFKKVKSIEIFDIGTVIGSHTGPGTVALFFVGAKRED
jgi:DegV family protein with EDD domain